MMAVQIRLCPDRWQEFVMSTVFYHLESGHINHKRVDSHAEKVFHSCVVIFF